MTLIECKDIALTIQSIITAVSLVVGGIWVYLKFMRQQEKYPNVEFLANMEFIGIQDDWWLVEIIATIENKGKAQHKMNEFKFDLNMLSAKDPLEESKEWGGQVNFPTFITEGSLLPQKLEFFFVDPGTKAKYSYLARVPRQARFIILHCWFKYADSRNYSHTAEKTVAVPDVENKKKQLVEKV